MSDQFVGEIRFFPFTYAPEGWLACDGSSVQISEYEVLFQLIGVTYGGDGQTTFKLPDLRGRAPVHQGTGTGLTPRSIGMVDGAETVTLFTQQLPAHNHVFQASTSAATQLSPAGGVPAALTDVNLYVAAAGGQTANPAPQMFGTTGGGTPHENCAPSLPILACISFYGVFPPRD